MMAASPGFAIPCTPIQVDLWSHRPTSRVFFLTHAHTDHTQGLTSTFALGPIYCTEVTKKIIVHRLGLDPDRVHALELNEPVTIPLDDEDEEHMTVTAVDANHCLGACMYVFQGYFGTVLATGDFRYSKVMLPLLPAHVDVLYLDNTYCHPKHCLPSRASVQESMLACIRQLPPCHVFLGVDLIGKEALLVALAVQQDAALHVSASRMALYQALGLAQYFTSSDEETYYHVVDRRSLTAAFLAQSQRKYGKVLGVLVSGHGVARADASWKSPAEWSGAINKHCIQVPYSNHSNFQEIDSFVACVKPGSLVNMLTTQSDHLYQAHGTFRLAHARAKVAIPPSVDRFMFRKGFTLARRVSETCYNRVSPSLKRTASNRGPLPPKKPLVFDQADSSDNDDDHDAPSRPNSSTHPTHDDNHDNHDLLVSPIRLRLHPADLLVRNQPSPPPVASVASAPRVFFKDLPLASTPQRLHGSVYGAFVSPRLSATDWRGWDEFEGVLLRPTQDNRQQECKDMSTPRDQTKPLSSKARRLPPVLRHLQVTSAELAPKRKASKSVF